MNKYRDASQQIKNEDREVKSHFDCVPVEYGLHPPIRSVRRSEPWRESFAERRWTLTVFQDAILWGAILAARMSLAEDRHAAGLEGGQREIELELSFGKRKKKHKRLKAAGRDGYRQGKRKAARRHPSEPIELTLSPTRLLKMSGLGNHGCNHAKLPKALTRLRRPVAVGGLYRPPPLRECEELPDGRLRLSVDTAWLPGKGYNKVPRGGPIRSAQARSLWYFLHSVDTGDDNLKWTSFESLCRRLGLPMRDASGASHALNTALELVNRQLRLLSKRETYSQFKMNIRGEQIRFDRTIHSQQKESSPPTLYESDIDRYASENAWRGEQRKDRERHKTRKLMEQGLIYDPDNPMKFIERTGIFGKTDEEVRAASGKGTGIVGKN